MAQVSIDQIRSRLAEVSARKAHYERKSSTPPERLVRHEVWRHDYLSFPYLIGAPDDRVGKRFCDIVMNTAELGPEGKIGVHDFAKDETPTQKFTHMLEEYGSRGGTPAGVIAAARAPVLRYFENGTPVAVKMFQGYQAPPAPFLVKYGRKEFLEPMIKEGRMRICPATFYNNTAFLQSVQDDERSRMFFIPTFRERLAGKDHLDFQGRRIVFGDDDINMPVICPDYFLFSLCDQIYYRLPTDFNADAALIIRNPGLFTQRVISHFLVKQPDWEPLHGPVTYYDPYRDYSKVKVAEMSKHFGYAYQREVRIAFRSKHPIHTGLQPEFLKIGAMTDYAELICT
ncbi:MAG: hypothetical protein WAL71_08405 [Terriglobales bacterium]|jgi:hypothetical protein